MGNMLLRDSDFMSMAHGLELRVPYIDRDLVEAVVGLPSALKLRPGRQKPLLVDSIRPALPAVATERRKRGFVLPFPRWLRSELFGVVSDTLASNHALLRAGLEPGPARTRWRTFVTGTDPTAWSRPWALYVLARWVARNGVGTPP
jgi:asparagine synthase (glutamine-hydrolysing)